MKKVGLIAAFAAALSVAAAFAQASVTVSTVEQFVKAIGSDRTIVLKDGTYTLGKSKLPGSANARWEEVSGGYELVITGVKNLRIENAKGNAIVKGFTPWGRVIAFEDSSNVTLAKLAFDHVTESACQAAVLAFSATEGATLTDCRLSGSGSIGVEAYATSGLVLKNCAITDCTSGAVTLNECYGAEFASCRIIDNQAYPLFFLQDCSGVAFRDCVIAGNEGQCFVTLSSTGGGNDGNGFYSCDVADNAIDSFTGDGEWPEFDTCAFAGNQFGDPTEGMGEGDGGAYEEGDGYLGPNGEGYEEGPGRQMDFYDHPSGLCVMFPPWWTSEENEGVAAIYSTESDQTVMVFPVYDLPGKYADAGRRKYFDEALKGYLLAMKSTYNTAASVKQAGDYEQNEDFVALEYRGTGTVDKKNKRFLVVRFVLYDGTVYAFSGSSADEELVGEGSELYELLLSICVPKG